MRQFDVCRNRGKGRSGYPYLVIVQSNAFDKGDTRVVIPLVTFTVGKALKVRKLHPVFTIEDKEVYLSPLDISSIPVERIGPIVTSLDHQADAIRDAIDDMMRVERGHQP